MKVVYIFIILLYYSNEEENVHILRDFDDSLNK